MPTSTTPASGAKARAKAARKPASAKAPTTRARSAARSTTKAKSTSASTSAKAAATPTSKRGPIPDLSAEVFGEYAERAVLIPVGAALIARDRVVSTVSDTISNYSSTSKTQAQLRRFERRGATARNRLEREVRKTRVRVERELRQRRREIESTLSDLEARRDAVAKNSSDLANRVPELANKVQERILSLV